MTITNETAIVTAEKFIMPTETSIGDFSAEDIGDDFEGLKLSFQRIKIPAGGGLQFEFPGDNPEIPDYYKTITGIIVYNHSANAYWPAGKEYDESIPPLCASYNGVFGNGIPGGICQLCEMNQYGTDETGGKGKACKNMRTLYILRSGDAMPIQLSLPPTSLTPFSDFMTTAFVSRRRPTWTSIIEIGLKRMDNGTNKYSVATFKRVCDLTAEQIHVMKEYAANFRAQIKDMQEQRATETESRTESDGIPDIQGRYMVTENGEHYEVSAVETINGGEDSLPY